MRCICSRIFYALPAPLAARGDHINIIIKVAFRSSDTEQDPTPRVVPLRTYTRKRLTLTSVHALRGLAHKSRRNVRLVQRAEFSPLAAHALVCPPASFAHPRFPRAHRAPIVSFSSRHTLRGRIPRHHSRDERRSPNAIVTETLSNRPGAWLCGSARSLATLRKARA